MYKNLGLWIFLICNTCFCYGQSNQLDSLDQVPFDSLSYYYYEFYEKKPQLAKQYADYYLKKAYKSKDSLVIAKAFNLKYKSSSLKEGIRYADSMILYSLNSDDLKYPTIGFLLKGYNLYSLGQDKKALESYLKALPYAKKKQTIDYWINILSFLGNFKIKWGDFDEALEYYKEQHELILKNNSIKEYSKEYLFNLNNQAYTFIYNKQLDSAKFYIDKGLIECNKYNDSDMYNRFDFLSAVYQFYSQDYSSCIKTLNKTIPLLKDEYLYLTVGYAYTGMAYMSLNNREKGIQYLLKTDSIYTIYRLDVPEVRNVLAPIKQEHYFKID